ncbi:hypothetical protein [Mesorhizobium sp. 113-3-3]|uniref:hypothetical protein n=1 Tax=Mesorhizobium sp. 113-3-3 TaxID=2744516 RepID=UPI0019268F61|nr:hypothetical protein [Mesorhizobium sp. 113-3-3]BCG83095.1 hypothetical protein MesoLj113b_66370 [Mesorhizobium sp. 113-3-3]
MGAKFAIISSILVILSSQLVMAEEPVQVAKKKVTKIVAGDGPFEIVNDATLFGYVTEVKGSNATFLPCYGKKFDVDISKLQRTKHDCSVAPPPDQTPFGVNCQIADETWGMFAPILAGEKVVPVGSTYEAGKDDVQLSDQVMAAIGGVTQIRNCNQSIVGTDKDGVAVIQIFLTPDKLNVPDAK